ncbi:hypothetical protein [Scleromatobacter humisilvae]|uniref:Porin n=1 Tax=Scleromatobacter humisilvae TaxID=2897159 RepID=A0A9X2C1A0_9BURK|nr:hypothetical protein [Scleromatobacter humisilvae]MCK9688052.1 hypothetical protein [Scleromatobacter humisilvae]
MSVHPHAAGRAPAPSFRPIRLVAALALAVGLQSAALASPASDIADLKKALAAMKSDYDKRIGALESQLHDTQAELAKARSANAAAPVATASAPAPATAVAEGPASVAPIAPPATVAVDTSVAAPTAEASGGATAFNPQISLILSGTYAHTSQDPGQARITGFALPPGAEIGVGSRGFSLAESELALAANIDPWLAGNINLSITGDDTISAEEAFITTTALPNGFVLKAGRFFSGIGYLNSQHSHTWDFVDNPIAYQAMLGTQYADDGVQLHWLAPTDQYMEFGLEAGRGRSFPGDNASRNAAGMTAFTFHTGGDIGDSISWRGGLSFLQTQSNGQTLLFTNADDLGAAAGFTGRTRVAIADGVMKWAPNGNATHTYFKLQGEYIQSRRSGDLSGLPGVGENSLREIQSGGYIQGVYQFMPMWRVGLRTERLDPGHANFGEAGFLGLAGNGYHPTKNSIMVDFSESEFARFRLQFAQDRTRQGFVDNQFLLQYQTALGAHGAHAY